MLNGLSEFENVTLDIGILWRKRLAQLNLYLNRLRKVTHCIMHLILLIWIETILQDGCAKCSRSWYRTDWLSSDSSHRIGYLTAL